MVNVATKWWWFVASVLVCRIPFALCSYNREQREERCITPNGTFVGISELVEFRGEHKHVTRFLAIPYAAPPIGNLRFMRPEPFPFQKGTVYNTTENRAPCIQKGYEFLGKQSEDCLHLNLFIPGKNVRKENNYAVMIYIHGGSFISGTGNVYSGDILSALNDVIVVTINYRLNVFGFLCSGQLGDGNFGLWDMHMAIQWVHNNIEYFGGDSTRVTLFGNSAGGAAVMYQAMYPLNKGLFHRIIAQSGSIFSLWALQREPSKMYSDFAAKMNCAGDKISDVVMCLQTANITYLFNFTVQIMKDTNDEVFIPCVDGVFVREDPILLAFDPAQKTKDTVAFFTELDLMTGIASEDGAEFVPRYVAETLFFSEVYMAQLMQKSFELEFNKTLSKTKLNALVKYYHPNISSAKEDIIHFQTDLDFLLGKSTKKDIINFQTDLDFLFGAILAAKCHTSSIQQSINGSTFLYIFNQVPSFAPNETKQQNGTTHAFELPYIFGFTKSLDQNYIEYYESSPFDTVSEEDMAMSETMMILWTNFAKYG